MRRETQTEAMMTESYIQKQLDQIDVNIEEVERLIGEENELIILRLCRGKDTSEQKMRSADLRLALAEMKKIRKSTASLSARSDAYLNRLPSRALSREVIWLYKWRFASDPLTRWSRSATLSSHRF